MADGTITIDVDIPTGKVKSDVQAINDEVNRIGNKAGNKLDENLDKNLNKAKSKASQTGKEIDRNLGKDHKTKITVEDSEAKHKANELKSDLNKLPKDHKVKINAETGETTEKVDSVKHKINQLPEKHNTEINATDHTEGVFARIKSHFDKINSEGKETHSIFKSVFSANIISNAAMSAFGAVRGALGGMIGEAKQYALEQQTMNATWLTLTNNAAKGKAMVNQINNMAAAAQNSTHMVDQLSQKFYAINNSAKQTGQLTKAVLTLQDAFGQSDAAIENFGTQFAQMMANGKVSAQDMMSIVNTFPKLKPMLLDYERQVHHSKNMTMSEMSDLMSKGKIKSQDMINVVLRAGQKFKKATGNFTATIPGMKRTVEAQMPRLLQAFEGPLTKMQSPIYGAVAKWVSSKKTENEFGKLGKTVSTGMANVVKAFNPGKSVNVTKTLDNAINGINKGLQGVFGWISGHAKDLKTIASSIASIGGQIAKAVWKDFASIITTIGNMFGLTAKNGKSSSGAIHVIAEALNGLAKNKAAIKAISDAIVAITVVKGLDKVGGGLFSIGEKGYGAYKKLKAFRVGLKGLDLAKDASKGEQAWAKAGSTITGALKGIHSGFSALKDGLKGVDLVKNASLVQKIFHGLGTGARNAGKLVKAAGKGIADASRTMKNAFLNQLHLVGKGIKSLGSSILDAARSVGSKALQAGKTIGSKISQGIKSLGSSILDAARSVGSKALQAGKTIGSKISQGIKATMKFSMGKRLAVGAVSGAAVAAPEIVNAVKDRHSADKRSQDIGGAVGALAGGTLTSMIPVVGPMLAPIGAIIGKYAGRWGGQAVNKFTKGWQRNKPPKKFWSLENLGWSTHDTFRKVGKWGADVGKKFGQGLRKGKSFAKKNSKELALTAVSPLLGIPALLYKNNPKFRKWANSVGRNVKKGLKTAGKAVKSFKNSLGRNFKKAWDSAYKHSSKGTRQIMRSVSKFTKNYVKTNSKANRETLKNFSSFGARLKKNHGNLFKTLGQTARTQLAIEKRRWSANWKNIRSAAAGIWKGINRNASDMYHKLNSATHGGLGKVFDGFKSFGKSIAGFWTDLWKNVTKTFSDTIKGLKDAANNVGKFFTGKLKVGSLHLAGGTDWRKRWATPAILNDGTDSPATHNRESIIHGNGTWEILPDIPFLKRYLLPTDDVVNAKDTAKLVSSFGNAVHFASGSVSVNDSPLYGIKDAVNRIYKVAFDAETLAKAEAVRKRKRDAEADRRHKKNGKDKSAKDKVKYSGTFKAKKSFDRLTKSIKNTSKRFKSLKSASRSASSSVKTLCSRASTLRKRVEALYKEVKKSKFGTGIKKQGEEAAKLLEGKGNFAKTFEKLTKNTEKSLKKMHSEAEKEFKLMWNTLKKESTSGESNIEHGLNSFKSKFRRQFRSIDSGVTSIFSRFWRSMKSTARNGLDGVIDVLNSAIGKIDNVIGQFGGSKSAVHKVTRLATGTGALGGVRRPITAPTLAILNDGYDSPATGNKEAIWDRNTGNVEVVPGRFTPRILKPGQEVFNATETAMLGYTSPQHFASGTGALKQLYEIAKRNWEKPKQTGQALFSSINGLTGAINQLAQGARSKGEEQGVSWWSQLWKMVENKVDDDDLGPASGLLKAVEKLGRGKHYLWGGYGLDSKGLDCSGLVSTALEYDYHSGWGHLDVGGLWRHAHRISRSEAKPGDPVFWLPDEHVGVYAGHGMYYSAYGPNNGGPIGMQPVGSGATFGRFKGINTEGSKNAKEAVKVKANNRLQKQIKNKVGQGFWKTIQKIEDKYGQQFNGANSISGSMIEAAARKMHVHLPDGFVKDVLRVAMSESGNRNIKQQIHDANSGGNEAQGPLQFTPQTFKAFAMPGHTNIHNLYDELLAFFNNSDWRNSIGWTTIWGHRKFDWLHSGPIGHRRFAIGGILNKPETVDVAEGGHPESIIPWDPAYRGRAYQIMQATLDQFKAQDGKSQLFQNKAQSAVDLTKTNAEIEAINEKFDQALAALGIITSKDETIQINNQISDQTLSAVYKRFKKYDAQNLRRAGQNISGYQTF